MSQKQMSKAELRAVTDFSYFVDRMQRAHGQEAEKIVIDYNQDGMLVETGAKPSSNSKRRRITPLEVEINRWAISEVEQVGYMESGKMVGSMVLEYENGVYSYSVVLVDCSQKENSHARHD